MGLVIPTNGSSIGRICAIDPGTNSLGLAVYEIDVQDGSILSADAMTFKSERLMSKDSQLIHSHSERIAKIFAQKENLVRMFRGFQPFFICCESPFYNRFRPTAYGPLMECLFAIKAAAIEYNELIPFRVFEPSIVKKAVGAHATRGGKDSVKIAVSNIEEIMSYLEVNFDTLDEHAIDALAVGYTYLKIFRKE